MTAQPDLTRAFFAIWPSPEVLVELDQRLGEIRGTSPPSLHWQPRHRLHLTLLFLGDCDPRRLQRARDVGRESVRQVPAAPVSISGAGTFGSVLWLGVNAPWLLTLHAELRDRLGLLTERRGFRAHLTVARSRGEGVAAAALPALELVTTRSWVPDALTLVAATSAPQPTYEILDRFEW